MSPRKHMQTCFVLFFCFVFLLLCIFCDQFGVTARVCWVKFRPSVKPQNRCEKLVIVASRPNLHFEPTVSSGVIIPHEHICVTEEALKEGLPHHLRPHDHIQQAHSETKEVQSSPLPFLKSNRAISPHGLTCRLLCGVPGVTVFSVAIVLVGVSPS